MDGESTRDVKFQARFSIVLVNLDVVEDGGFRWFPPWLVCRHSIAFGRMGNIIAEGRDGRSRKHRHFGVFHLEPPTDGLGPSGNISVELILHVSNPERRGNMLAVEAGRVRLTIRKLEFASFGSEVVRENVMFFNASFSYVAMPAGIVGDIIVDGNFIGVVDNDATLVGLDDDIVRDDGRRVVRQVKVYGVSTCIKKAMINGRKRGGVSLNVRATI